MDTLLWTVLIIILSPVIIGAGFIALLLIAIIICLIIAIPVMIIVKIMDWIF